MEMQEGGGSTCLQDYINFQYNDKGEPTKYNTDYKFFLVELYLASKAVKNKDDTYKYDSINVDFQSAIEVMYKIQDCINEFVYSENGSQTSCITNFVKHVNEWDKQGQPKIQKKKGTIEMMNEKGILKSEDIQRIVTGKATFNGFLERFSERLDNILASQKVSVLDLYIGLLSNDVTNKLNTTNDDAKYAGLNGHTISINNVSWKNGYSFVSQLFPEQKVPEQCITKFVDEVNEEKETFIKKYEKKSTFKLSMQKMERS